MEFLQLKNNFPNAVIGFSDHSIGPYISLGAVALGASIIERHFTDHKYRKGPDISCSMDPTELKLLIEESKNIHKALRNKKFRSNEEEDVYLFARSSLIAFRDIDKGNMIKEEDIWSRRPGSGEIPDMISLE